MAELKPWPLYVWKVLSPSNGKNHVEPSKNEKFIAKTYTFDETKCDVIFDLLVADGQIIVPKGLKMPPLEKGRRRVFINIVTFLVIKHLNFFFSRIWCKLH